MEFNDLQALLLTHLPQLIRFDKERINVHVFWGIGYAPFNTLDNEKIAQEIAVEGMEEKEASRL